MTTSHADHRRYWDDVTHGIRGWLDPFTAQCTMELLDYQDRGGVTGGLYEVGVYLGKYFSVLYRSAKNTNSPMLALDMFNDVTREQFESTFLTATGAREEANQVKIVLLHDISTKFTEHHVLQALGMHARFISVDGSHDFHDVLYDLTIADRAMRPEGIIAADDFLNPNCLGTNEAINHFLKQNLHLVPFAYIAGKLMICRRSFANEYKGVLERYAMADTASDKARSFQKALAENVRHSVEPVFHGVPALSFP